MRPAAVSVSLPRSLVCGLVVFAGLEAKVRPMPNFAFDGPREFQRLNGTRRRHHRELQTTERRFDQGALMIFVAAARTR